MKKLLLLALVVIGGVMQASAGYYMLSKTNGDWFISAELTDDDGDNIYSGIYNLPTYNGNLLFSVIEGTYTVFGNNNSIDWNNVYRPNSDGNFEVWSYESLTFNGKSNTGNVLSFPTNYSNAYALKLDFTPSSKYLKVTRLVTVSSKQNGWTEGVDYLEASSPTIETYSGVFPLLGGNTDSDGFVVVSIESGSKVSRGIKEWQGNNYFSKDEGKTNIKVTDDGVYSFTAQYSPDTYQGITRVKATASVTSVGYATFSSEYALDFTNVTDVTPYRATVTSEDKVLLTKVTGKVPAETGLLLVAEGEASVDVPTTIYTTSIGENMLVATVEETTVAANNNNYMLANTNGVGFYSVDSETTSGAGKAYLHTDNALASEGSGSRVAWIFDDKDITAIKQVATTARTNEVFDLQGRRVAQPTKGLYIVNGKKVIK